MFDHVTIRVSDRDASTQFYDTVLRTLGIERPGADETYTEWDAAAKVFYELVAPFAGYRLRDDTPARVRFAGGSGSFSLLSSR